MVHKKTSLVILALTLITLLSVNALAITASIGNSRMVLRLETGETIEKYILVRNINDESVTIDLSASGELADRVTLEEEMFELGPGEEKNAYFTISALEEGTTETKINIRYTPEEGNGVGLTSTVIVIASGETVEEDLSDQETEDSPGFLARLQGQDRETEEEEARDFDMDRFMLVSTILLVVVLGGMYFYSQTKNKKKKVGRQVA